MSWWTKNRKKVGMAAGLLGGAALLTASGGSLAGLLPGLLGGTPAAGGATGAAAGGLGTGLLGTEGAVAGATLPEALAASKGVGQAAMATKGGIDAAIAAEGGSEMGLAGTKAVSDAYFGQAAPAVQKAAGFVGNLGNAMTPSQASMGLLGLNAINQGQGQPVPSAPPPPPAAPMPKSSFAGYGDPMANLTEEQKQRLLAMLQAQRGMA